MRTALAFLLLASGCGADRAPGPSLIALRPRLPDAADDLTVEVHTDAVDPDGDKVSYSYLWYRDNELQSDYTEEVLPADATAKGEIWRVEVVAVAGGLEGPPVLAEVQVLNTLPTVELTMDPAEPIGDQDITAIATANDADGDTVVLDWTWTVNGADTSYTDETIPASETQRWQTWEVTVVPFDGVEYGEPAVASAVVGNAPPTVESVTLGPEEAYEDTVLEVTVETSDLEGDLAFLEYAWYVDGSLVSDATGASLTGEWFAKHQEIWVEVTASDGYDSADPVASNSVTPLNTAPTLTTVALDPAELYEGSTATCVGSDLDDIDGDDLTVAYAWFVNDAEVSNDASIDGDLFDRGDSVYCSAGADDGEEVGPTVESDPLTVLNSLPVVPSVSIAPSSPVEGDTITATVGTATDDDGDEVSVSYAWYVDGSQVSTSTELGSDLFDKHQAIHLEVTAHDGIESGEPTASGTVTALNTAPSFTGLSTDPAAAIWGSTISAATSGWSDADGDAEAYDYSWYVDGTVVGSDSSLDLSGYDRGLEVYLEATANDGDDVGNTLTSDVMVIQRLLYGSDADLIFDGQASDNAGLSLSLAGDLTGDGISNFIVGAPGNNDEASGAGALYVVSGGDTGNLDYLDVEVFLWGTEESEAAGWSVAGLGDVNSDGYEDFIAGVPNDSTFSTTSGAAFVMTGPMSSDSELGAAGIAILGTTSGEHVGYSVAGPGDVNYDGVDDILVGAHGKSSSTGAAYLAYGPFTSTHYSTAMDITMAGEAAGDEAGCAVTGAGDVDGDGNVDVLVGAQGESSAGTENGAAYLLYGPLSVSWGLAYADAKLTGEDTMDNAGYAVSTAGDVDGDGNPDILVGSRWEDSGGSAAGAAYLVTGAVTGTTSLSAAQAKLIGDTDNQLAGNALSGMGDIDSDGYDDIVVAAEGDDSAGSATGAVFVVLGPLSGTLDLADEAYATIWGDAAGDALGFSLAAGQDVDGDGQPDLVVGAPYDDSYGSAAGAAFLFSGADI